MSNSDFRNKIYKRCLDLTIKTVKLVSVLDLKYEYSSILKQLIRSISSIGANFTEGNGAVSKSEFTQFINHSRKSTLESIYWLDILKEIDGV